MAAKHENDQWDHNIEWQRTQISQNYDTRRFSSWSGRMFDSLEKRTINRLLSDVESDYKIQKVLDVPCGTGRYIDLFLGRGYEVICGDISQEMMEVARSKFIGYSKTLSFQNLDIYNLPFEDNYFDCVFSIRLFQHLTSDERSAALTELCRVTKRYAIVNVMYSSGYYAFIRNVRKLLGRYAPRYTTTMPEQVREAQNAGFKLIERKFPQPFYNGNMVLLFEKIA